MPKGLSSPIEQNDSVAAATSVPAPMSQSHTAIDVAGAALTSRSATLIMSTQTTPRQSSFVTPPPLTDLEIQQHRRRIAWALM